MGTWSGAGAARAVLRCWEPGPAAGKTGLVRRWPGESGGSVPTGRSGTSPPLEIRAPARAPAEQTWLLSAGLWGCGSTSCLAQCTRVLVMTAGVWWWAVLHWSVSGAGPGPAVRFWMLNVISRAFIETERLCSWGWGRSPPTLLWSANCKYSGSAGSKVTGKEYSSKAKEQIL